MSSGNEVTTATKTRLQLPPGHQALVSLPPVGSAYSALPPGAGDRLVVVSADSPADVADTLEAAGVDPAGVAVVPVSGGRVEYSGPLDVTEAVLPADLTGLSMRLSDCLDGVGPGGWVVFDRLNVLLLYADQKRVVRFLDHVADTVRDADLKGLFCVAREALAEETYGTLRRRVDSEPDLR